MRVILLLAVLLAAASLSAARAAPLRKARGQVIATDPTPPLLPVPGRPEAPTVDGTAGRSRRIGEVTITPGGFVGVDGQIRLRP